MQSSWPKKSVNPHFHALRTVSPGLSTNSSPSGPFQLPPRTSASSSAAQRGVRSIPRAFAPRSFSGRPHYPSHAPVSQVGTWLMHAQAVRNFFKERGRIRDVVVKLPRASSGVWSTLAVCSEVYKSAINELVEEVSGCKPGTRGGYISEYSKARQAFFLRLSDAQRGELERIAKQWNRTGTPKSAKLKCVLRFLQCTHY